MSVDLRLVAQQCLGLLGPCSIEERFLQQIELFGSRLVVTIHNHTLSDALRAASALPTVQDRLLSVEHIALRRVHHAQSPESLRRRQHRGQVSYAGHDQRVLTTLVEVEHTVGQQSFLRQGEVYAVRPEGCPHLMVTRPLHDLVPTFVFHQIVLADQFIHILVVTTPLRIAKRDAVIVQSRHCHLQGPLGQQPGIDHQLHGQQPTRRPQVLPTKL